MTLLRMPIFTWNMVVTSVLVLLAFPVLTAAGALLFADRHLDGHAFDAANGGVPILWQHLFWWFGHPEVYILILPFFGIITDVIAVFARRPVFGYRALVHATLAIAALSMGVWAHHMFATGVVLLPFFSGLSLLIAVPTGVKFFSWIGTMWGGQISFDSPMLFSLGFLCMFVLGGLSGVLLASPPGLPPPRQLLRRSPPPLRAVRRLGLRALRGDLLLVPEVLRATPPRGMGRLHFVLMFIGFNMTFFVQHRLGLEGMPRRVADYLPSDGFTFLNQISTIGSFLLGASTLPFPLERVADPAARRARATTRGTATRSSGPPPLLRPRGTSARSCPHPVGAAGVGRQPPGRPVDQRLVVRGERDPILT